jgi:glucosamine kinase
VTNESRHARSPRVDAVACVDLGKTNCRVRVVEAESGETLVELQGNGAPGLADSRGAIHAAQSIEAVIRAVPEDARASITHIVVGAAGTEAAPRAAQDLARQIGTSYGTSTTVTSDVVIAHAGALRGAAGTVLIVGTGAVALSLHPDGTFHQADGWGPWVGDEGGGRWIGQEGIRLGLRSLDRRDAPSALAAAVKDMIGSPQEVPAWISTGDNPAKTLASFAQIVLDLAEAGDRQASDIIRRSIQALVESARTVSRPAAGVAIVGGIVTRSGFRHALESALVEIGLSPIPSSGGPLEGALLLAARPAAPYEKKVFHA